MSENNKTKSDKNLSHEIYLFYFIFQFFFQALKFKMLKTRQDLECSKEHDLTPDLMFQM